MAVEILRPSSREDWLSKRRTFVGASEAPALLGAHPYLTAFELAARKTGLIADDVDSPPMKRGRMLEKIGVEMIAEERPEWDLTPNAMPGGKLFRNEAARLSCTPDLFAIDPVLGPGIVQIKSTHPSRFRQDWRDESGQVMPPLYATVQALVEAELTGASWCAVASLVIDHGVDVHIIEVPRHPGVIKRVYEEAARFWDMVDRGEELPIDFARDGDAIERMFSSDDGSEADLSRAPRADQIVLERSALAAAIKAAEEEKKALDAEMKNLLGNHAAGRLADGRVITWRTIQRRGYEVAPTQYRQLRYPS